eukprot:2122902-Heterocapsa_arctica.AAC.1
MIAKLDSFDRKLKTASTLSDYDIQADAWLGVTHVEVVGGDEATITDLIAFFEGFLEDLMQIQ